MMDSEEVRLGGSSEAIEWEDGGGKGKRAAW